MQNNQIRGKQVTNFKFELTKSLQVCLTNCLTQTNNNQARFKAIASSSHQQQQHFSSQSATASTELQVRWRAEQPAFHDSPRLRRSDTTTRSTHIWFGRNRRKRRQASLHIRISQQLIVAGNEENFALKMSKFHKIGRQLRQISERFEARQQLIRLETSSGRSHQGEDYDEQDAAAAAIVCSQLQMIEWNRLFWCCLSRFLRKLSLLH